jgi:hypothetical protein
MGWCVFDSVDGLTSRVLAPVSCRNFALSHEQLTGCVPSRSSGGGAGAGKRRARRLWQRRERSRRRSGRRRWTRPGCCAALSHWTCSPTSGVEAGARCWRTSGPCRFARGRNCTSTRASTSPGWETSWKTSQGSGRALREDHLQRQPLAGCQFPPRFDDERVPGHIPPDDPPGHLALHLDVDHLRVEAQERGVVRGHPDLGLAPGGHPGEHELLLAANTDHGRLLGLGDGGTGEQGRRDGPVKTGWHEHDLQGSCV